MKYLFFAILILCKISVFAQSLPLTKNIIHSAAIELAICQNKTTLIVFPTSIKRGDVGHEGVTAEVVKGTNNILRIKADQKFFEPTNLNVITADGKVHVFNVVYSEYASGLPVYVSSPTQLIPALFSGEVMNESQIDDVSTFVYNLPLEKFKRKRKKYGMQLALNGVFINEGLLFLKFQLHNCTNLEYKVESFRFFVRDKRIAKRTATQDTEMQPVFVKAFGNIESDRGQTIIVALPKFTIAENKLLVAEMMEEKGDRNLTSHFGQGVLLRAKKL